MPHTIENLQYFIHHDNNPRLGFIVQSGFPESHHSIYVESYLKKLCEKFNSEYIGTAIKGGVEGIKNKPAWMTKKVFNQFEELGASFAKTGFFSENIEAKMIKPFQLSPTRIAFFKLMQKTGLINFFWDSQLKKNNAFDIRYAKPHEHK